MTNWPNFSKICKKNLTEWQNPYYVLIIWKKKPKLRTWEDHFAWVTFDGINMMQGYNFIMGLFTMGNVIAFPAEHFQTSFALILFQFLSRLPQAMVFGFVGFEFLDVEKDFGTLWAVILLFVQKIRRNTIVSCSVVQVNFH